MTTQIHKDQAASSSRAMVLIETSELFQLDTNAASPEDLERAWTRIAELDRIAEKSGDPLMKNSVSNCIKYLTLRWGKDMFPPTPPATEAAGWPLQENKLRSMDGIATRGISLVTCSMNRSANLMRALPSWLNQAEISEIIIIDWSSAQEVQQELTEAGFADPRIQVIRVEGEPRWILSQAFNCGFRAARFDTVLKVDADIVLAEDFFSKNILRYRSFIAGNWRNATEGQAFVNGFFYVSKDALAEVGGFCEFITSYGWDDDDLYSRLLEAGYSRRDVVQNSVFHLPHSDAERLGAPVDCTGQSLLDEYLTGPRFLIHRNRYVAAMMPRWHRNSPAAQYEKMPPEVAPLKLRKIAQPLSAVPEHILATARFHALLDFFWWAFGMRALQLDESRLNAILSRPAKAVTVLDLEAALAGGPSAVAGQGGYIVLMISEEDSDTFGDPAIIKDIRSRFIKSAEAGYRILLSGKGAETAKSRISGLEDLPVVPLNYLPDDLSDMSFNNLSDFTANPQKNYCVKLASMLLADAPAVISRTKRRLYIDAQHGLGNRLRAIGSAAAIANATDRELVIVWSTDHHCGARFCDLFEYDGPIVEHSFLSDARVQGMMIYNYMPIEDGAVKDLPVDADGDDDIYARAAFVLRSPHSTWVSENRFLQQLVPVAAVRNLVASVRHPNDISAHIRMEAGPGLDNNSYDRPDNWRDEDHQLIHKWRAKSHFSRFMSRLDSLIVEGSANSIFIAADLPDTYQALSERYGERLAWLPRPLYDRSASQLHYALADAILLSQAPKMLGSSWSSFSELAMRLAPNGIAVEMSGEDF